MDRKREAMLITVLVLIIISAIAGDAGLTKATAQSLEQSITIYPGGNMKGGESVLVLAPSKHLTAKVKVTVVVQAEGKETRYDWSRELVLDGLEWPYSDKTFFYILPGMPGGDIVISSAETTYIVRVRTIMTLSLHLVDYSTNKTIEWSGDGIVNEGPVAILYVPSGDNYTLYLSPSGWTAPAGTYMDVLVAGFGFHGDPVASIFAGTGKTYVQYSMKRYPAWWGSLGELVDNITEWFNSLEINDSRLAGHLPKPQYAGGIWVTSILLQYEGMQLYYYGRIVDGKGSIGYTMKGTVIITIDSGPRIVMVDDDLLLHLVSNENKYNARYIIQELPHVEQLEEVYFLGDALVSSGLAEKHYYTTLASMGRLTISFPGVDALKKLGGDTDLIYMSGLPPSIPGTILDWNKTAKELVSRIKSLYGMGARLILTSTSISSINSTINPYPLTMGNVNESSIASMAGVKQLVIAYTYLGNKIIAPLPRWSGTLTSTNIDPSTPHTVKVNNTITVMGWQGVLPGCKPEANPDFIKSPWLTLLDKGITRLPLREIGEEVSKIGEEIEKTSYSLKASTIAMGKLVFYTDNRTTEVSATWMAKYLADNAVPVMLSRDCMAGVFLYTPLNPRAIVFTFEPESDPTGGSVLLNWALDKLLKQAPTSVKLDGFRLPPEVAQRVMQMAEPGINLTLGIIPGGGLIVNASSEASIVVIPYGEINLTGARTLYRDPSGLLYKVFGKSYMLVPIRTYYLIPYLAGPARQPSITTTTTPPVLPTTTTTTSLINKTNTMTMTKTSTHQEKGVDSRIILLITVVAILVSTAIIYYHRRHPYKYI